MSIYAMLFLLKSKMLHLNDLVTIRSDSGGIIHLFVKIENGNNGKRNKSKGLLPKSILEFDMHDFIEFYTYDTFEIEIDRLIDTHSQIMV